MNSASSRRQRPHHTSLHRSTEYWPVHSSFHWPVCAEDLRSFSTPLAVHSQLYSGAPESHRMQVATYAHQGPTVVIVLPDSHIHLPVKFPARAGSSNSRSYCLPTEQGLCLDHMGSSSILYIALCASSPTEHDWKFSLQPGLL